MTPYRTACCLAFCCLLGAAEGNAATSYSGALEEERPSDLRPEHPSPYSAPLMCRLWLRRNTTATPPWQLEGLPVVYFGSSASVTEYFEAHPDAFCRHAHWVPGNARQPEEQWLQKTVKALWGRVERELVIEGADDPEVCKSLLSLKGQGLIERERCRFSANSDYGFCKCHSSRKAPKLLICVPPDHRMLLTPSPLLSSTSTCIARMGYRSFYPATDVAPSFTPPRPYPELDASKPTSESVRVAALSYINSKTLLDGTADTFRTWVPYFLVPQNMSLFVIREKSRVKEEEVVQALRLVKDSRAEYYRTQAFEVSPPIYLSETLEGFPPGLNATLLSSVRPRCGCGPLCSYPTKNSPDAFMISSLRYVQGTSVFVYELLKDPRLKAFDFVIKVDWDIRFFRTLKQDIFREILALKKWGFHTGYANNGNGCSRDCSRAFDAFGMAKGLRAASAGDWMYENEQTTWHSALFGIWTGLVLSPEYQEMMDFIRNHAALGYSWYRYRWTDQSLWPKIVGFFHKDTVDAMLDLRKIRWNPNTPRPMSVFYHRKRPRSDHEVCCGKCSDDVDRPCWKKKKTSPYVHCLHPDPSRVRVDVCER